MCKSKAYTRIRSKHFLCSLFENIYSLVPLMISERWYLTVIRVKIKIFLSYPISCWPREARIHIDLNVTLPLNKV